MVGRVLFFLGKNGSMLPHYKDKGAHLAIFRQMGSSMLPTLAKPSFGWLLIHLPHEFEKIKKLLVGR